MNSALLILVRGLPGSGKTYLATRLQSFVGDNAVMLDPDATDYSSQEYVDHTNKLAGEGVDQALHAYRFLRGKAYDVIAGGGTVIWNQPFTNLEIFNKMVARLQTHADMHDVKLKILVVEVQINPAIAKVRVNRRKLRGGHGPSEGTFVRFARDYHSFANEGYNTVTVQGDDVKSAIATVSSALSNL